MSKSVHRIAAGLAAALVTTLAATLPASPAAADEPFQNPDEGLVFYSSNPTAVVGRQAAPDDVCRLLPADANWLLAWSGGFRSVGVYRTADCSGQVVELGTFRSWQKGTFLSYRTS